MFQLINLFVFIIFLNQCYTQCTPKEIDKSDNDLSHEFNDINNTIALFDTHLNDTDSKKLKYNITEDISEEDGHYTNSSETVETGTEVASKEGAGCMYQNSKSKEYDDDDSKSTLVDYPYSVSIQKKGSHYVSGALVDKNWIISVAGELYNVRESLKLYRARLGSVDCKRGGILVPIKAIEIHPYYIYGKPNFDVSLLRMAIPVKFSELISPIGISTINGKVLSAKFMTTYWPRIVLNGKTIPENAKERTKYNSMRVSTQRLIPENMCQTMMAAMNEHIHEASLCLKSVVAHHSVCMPDPGAPVVAEDGLWGITSGWVSPMCPKLASPTLFTRLSSLSVRSWLDIQLKLEV